MANTIEQWKEELATKAIELLKLNSRTMVKANGIEEKWTVPSANLYPHMWAWDSAFSAIGFGHFDVQRGVDEIKTLMNHAWPNDGRVPHIIFHDLSGDYFPPPSMYGTDGTHESSTISQPPVWATAARRLLDMGADKDQIKALLPAIAESHLWFKRDRDPLDFNCVSVAHPWESGMDNCPAWDKPMDRLDPTRAPHFERRDKNKVTNADQRPTDDHYKRYILIVRDIVEDKFRHGPFRVYCPLMTAILCRAEVDLAKMAQQLGEPEIAKEAMDRAHKIRQGLLDHLWSAELGRFTFYDVDAKVPVTPDQIGCYVPIMLNGLAHDAPEMVLPADVTEALIANLRKGFLCHPTPLPSMNPNAPDFDGRRYWRGPSWVNINYLIAPSLPAEDRDQLVEKTLRTLEREGFWEYFDPLTGDGLGANHFSWSAALALDWIRAGVQGA